LPLAEKVLLPDKFIERTGAHSRGQRLSFATIGGFAGGKEGHELIGAAVRALGNRSAVPSVVSGRWVW